MRRHNRVAVRFFASGTAIAAALLLSSTRADSIQASAPPLPRNWEQMEIESKWEVTPAQYAQLMRFFAKGTRHLGYPAEIRWGGISRRFVDNYYDTLGGALEQGAHSLRHRARYESKPRAPDNSIRTLDRATWDLEWEAVQYKSTPCRIGATWFRHESGRCNIRHSEGQDLCVAGRQLDPAEMLLGDVPNHDGMASLRRDHPSLSLKSLRPVLNVSDYRYRVTFGEKQRVQGKEETVDIYELSLDRLTTTDLVRGGSALSYEAELEIVAPPTRERVLRLLQFSRTLERRFGLKPSIHSKSGVRVGQCVPTQSAYKEFFIFALKPISG